MIEILPKSISQGNNSLGDILIVDDEPDNLEVLSTILESQGYQVRQAVNADVALRTIQLQKPQLILLDVRMPVIDGYQLCEQLKSSLNTQDIPIIFLSALGKDSNKGRGFQLGAVDFITKPFQIEETLARVKHQLTIRNLQIELQQKNYELREQNFRLQAEIYIRQQMEDELKHSQALLEAKNKELVSQLGLCERQ